MKKNGFTLMELLVVIIIIGVLATLGIAQYKAPKETVLDKDAKDSLMLIYAQERVYHTENNAYLAYTSTSNINTGLKLQLKSNWDYTVSLCSSTSGFYAQAYRSAASNPTGVAKYWCLKFPPTTASASDTSSVDPTITQATSACGCPS